MHGQDIGRSEVNEGTTAAAPSGASDLITALLQRAPRLATVIAASQVAWPVAKRAREKSKELSRYTVKVLSTDDIYDDLHEWVLGLLPPADQRALVAWTSNRDAPTAYADSPGGPLKPSRVRLRYDGSREQSIRIGGHRISVLVNDPSEPSSDGKRWKAAEITFTAPSLAAQRSLIDEISQVARRSSEAARKPVFRTLDRWGDWRRLDDLPARDLDSVILPSGQLERLVDDVSKFLEAEDDYLRRCVPWHRGHLYEGPPGTGKTSVARAIATHFNMDIWYLPLADVKKDCDLLAVINRITPRSMLLLEDADVFHAATQRDENAGVTLSGLLNALDGIATPHGLLTVMTTNSPDSLDSAVVRPGRVDLVEHFGNADRAQVARLLGRWYDEPVHQRLVGNLGMVSPAEVVEACKRSATVSAAVAALRDRRPR